MTARFLTFAVLALAPLGLQGCFVSPEPLLTASEADFPFKTLTFKSESKSVTLSRDGDLYRIKGDDDAPTYLFKKIGEDLYIGQAAGKNKKGKPETVYGIVERRGTHMEIRLPTCSDADEADLKQAGITRVDKWFVDQCPITSLEQMEKLALAIKNKDVKIQQFTIESITN